MSARVGLAIIARDAAKTLPVLLASCEGAFKRVVLLDTGSTDDTVVLFQRWAREQSGVTFSVADFEWCDDFAAARNAADALLLYGGVATDPIARPMVDWTCWADADDELVGARELQAIAASQPPAIGAVIFSYDYVTAPSGEVLCHLRRERLVRAAQAGRWTGAVHEAQMVENVVHGPEAVRWVHRKALEDHGTSNERNLKILTAWQERDADNPRVLAYLGTEHAARGDNNEAIRWFDAYFRARPGWDQERAQVRRKLAVCLMQRGDVDNAERHALRAVSESPEWPDSYITLAEVALARQEAEKAVVHANIARGLGQPHTLLITNPADYTLGIDRLTALAYAQTGREQEAELMLDAYLQAAGPEPIAADVHARLHAHNKAARTAEHYALLADQLVAHDEQEKALTLLQQVPHFAVDHPLVVAKRSEVRERLLWSTDPALYAEHYQTGGSKPEDFHGDEMMAELAGRLPRAHFLLDGLAEQAAA